MSQTPSSSGNAVVKVKCSCGKWAEGTMVFDFTKGKVSVQGCCA